MKPYINKFVKRVPVLIALVAVLLQTMSAGANSLPQQAVSSDVAAGATRIDAHAGQVIRTQVQQPNNQTVIKAVNHSDSTADVDFIALDAAGNELARQSEIVGPGLKAKFNLQTVFPELSFDELSSVQVQSSVRPREKDAKEAKDSFTIQSQLPVAFFSQRDSRWSGNQLGSCSGTTIGSAGCYISCIAMAGAHVVVNCNPASMNTYLTNNAGYVSGCSVIYSAAANIDGSGGFLYIGSGTVGTPAYLKSQIDGGKFLMAKSVRFSPSTHVGLIIGYNNAGTVLSDFYYLDPWDTTATFRQVGDGFVNSGAVTQIFQ